MKSKSFEASDFLLRFALAFLLVSITTNPTELNLAHWLVNIFPRVTPLFMLITVLTVIGWTIYLRATYRSLGWFGIALAVAFIASIFWLLYTLGLFAIGNGFLLGWFINLGVAFLLAIGMSWSHIRRKLSGQQDVDDVGDI